MAAAAVAAPAAAPALAPPPERSGEPLCLCDGTPVWLRSTGPATDCDERAELLAEDAGGRAVGRVAYRRVYGPRAVLTLEVDDELWPLGLPEALIAGVGPLAATGGISTLLVRIPESDERLLGLLLDEFAARLMRDMQDVEVEVQLGVVADGG